jgi:hypothetical protein
VAGFIVEDSRQRANDSPSTPALLPMLVAAWSRERALFWTGLFLLFLALAGGVVLMARGRFIAPEGDLAKPIAFDVGLGIYVLTLAAVARLVGFSARMNGYWRAVQMVLALGSVAVANVQTYRGIDPRFPGSGMAIDRLASMLFGVLAVAGSVSFLVLTVSLFRRPADASERLLVLGLRYGAMAALIGYATGLWMILNGGAHFGEAGDILPLHALAFHGLQAAPVVAVLLGWRRMPSAAPRPWVHVAGCAWLVACAALAWQTLQGRSVLEPAPATVVALVALLVWALAMAYAVRTWFR